MNERGVKNSTKLRISRRVLGTSHSLADLTFFVETESFLPETI
jgi:hypothetical protein